MMEYMISELWVGPCKLDGHGYRGLSRINLEPFFRSRSAQRFKASDMAVVTVIGDGSNTLFWKDKWLQGKRIKEIAPAVYDMVPKRIVNRRKVSEVLLNC
jgi:hypothetical protein